VIVSEWMGAYGVDENHVSPLLVARESLPESQGNHAARTGNGLDRSYLGRSRDHELNFWRNKPYDLDLSLISNYTAHEVFFYANRIYQKILCGSTSTPVGY
jgi:hypothetical protein